ncbi:MAG: Electron transfer flavoprotein-ubiquinone oxidoreductase [Syntrophorhabdaceae bacterium PtaU1.Bin034]|nr:MAG: Electron transfer flavoprotein-ubiquinone oxidoreductase [Syntrophorhabdaceae bacterium PtaU1.Bin034]
MDKFDAVIVGGGLAGLAAAYRLADAGRQVILLERGDAPGSKNVTGGRIYLSPIRHLLPGLFDDAPFERQVVKEILTITDEKSATRIEYTHDKWREAPFMSHTVLRARFDNWLSEKVMEKGAFIIPRRRVDDLLWEDGRVAGVRAGTEEIPAQVVIAADGALSFMAEKANMRQPLIPGNYAVAVKEVYSLGSDAIEERFGVGPGEGAANLFMGSVTNGLFGGGFLYTNIDSLSVGIVIGINALAEAKQAASLPELVAQFESRPEIQRYIKGAELKEYSAHVITEAGINGISRLSMPGMLVVGDAAGFALNMGVTVRGMEFAIASGVTAAEVVDEALKKGDFSSQSLSLYDRRMKESFVIKDMETFRHSRDILENPRLFTVYPRFISNLLGAVFEVNSEPKKGLYRTASEIARTYVANWEGFKDFLSFRKV